MPKPEIEGVSRFHEARDGLRLHLRDYDPGSTTSAPVFCLAGLTRNGDDFAPLARALANDPTAPRRVVTFDYRGRGLSGFDPDWTHYTLPIEWADVLAGLRVCGIESAHVIGTSRGGLHVLAMAATHRARLRSVILNDIGPVLEPAGLFRIKTYIGALPRPKSTDEAVSLLKAGSIGQHFPGLTDDEWRFFAATTFGTDENDLGPRYDLELARILDAFDLSQPLPDLWSQFDDLRGTPVLAIRGEHSDLLSPATLEAMRVRWDGCETFVIPGQGHAPLLTAPASIDRIKAFLAKAEHG